MNSVPKERASRKNLSNNFFRSIIRCCTCGYVPFDKTEHHPATTCPLGCTEGRAEQHGEEHGQETEHQDHQNEDDKLEDDLFTDALETNTHFHEEEIYSHPIDVSHMNGKKDENSDSDPDCISDENSKEEFGKEEALDKLVDMYLSNDMVNIALLPDFIERHFYKSILRSLFKKVELKVVEFQGRVWGRDLRLDVTACTLPQAVCQACETVPNDKRTDEHHERNINRLVERFIKTNTTTPSGIPLIGYFTDQFERILYTNVLKMTIGILEDTLKTASIDVLGHRIGFSMEAFEMTPRSEDYSLEEDEHFCKSVDEQVDYIMATCNITGLPDFIERYLYTRAMGMVMATLTETLRTIRFRFMHQCITIEVY